MSVQTGSSLRAELDQMVKETSARLRWNQIAEDQPHPCTLPGDLEVIH